MCDWRVLTLACGQMRSEDICQTVHQRLVATGIESCFTVCFSLNALCNPFHCRVLHPDALTEGNLPRHSLRGTSHSLIATLNPTGWNEMSKSVCVCVCVSVFVPCKLPVLPFEMYDRANFFGRLAWWTLFWWEWRAPVHDMYTFLYSTRANRKKQPGTCFGTAEVGCVSVTEINGMFSLPNLKNPCFFPLSLSKRNFS